jgi:hypothetical protein
MTMHDKLQFGCAAFHSALPSYLSGALSNADAAVLELHASECERCEARLDSVTRMAVDLAPPLPAELRARTLQAVSMRAGELPSEEMRAEGMRAEAFREAALRREGEAAAGEFAERAPALRITASRRRVAFASLAIAAALAVILLNTRSADAPGAVGSPASPAVRSAVADPDVPALAIRVATEHARAEFAELEAAERELEAALEESPSDSELRVFLVTVRARQDELERRVKEAAS